MALAGMSPNTTPLSAWCDASWAVLMDMIPDGIEDRGEHIDNVWEQVTGGPPVLDHSPSDDPSAPPSRDVGTEEAIRTMSDDDMAKWVPAYSKADYDDAAFDKFWSHTARFAGGQAALINLAGGSADGSAPPTGGE